MTTTAENLPYPAYEVQPALKPKALQGLSEKLIDQHWKLFEAYITNTNFLNKGIWEAIEAGTEINKPNIAEMQRRLGFEYNGMVLHEYYFGALRSGVPEPSPASAFGQKLALDFGSFDRWKKQFSEIGKMRGVGWVITSLDPRTHRLNTFWIGDNEVGHIAGFLPIVVMDMWEHSYVSDYGASPAAKSDYVQAYFKNLDWETTAKRLEAALRMQVTLQ